MNLKTDGSTFNGENDTYACIHNHIWVRVVKSCNRKDYSQAEANEWLQFNL